MSAFAENPRITPFLWFDGNAEQAVKHYLSIFENSRQLEVMRSGPGPSAGVLTIAFELDGLRFVALNGGPLFRFTEAISFVVRCNSQQEIDHYWASLSAGGSESQCGWLKDKFGLSWQIVPAQLTRLINKPEAFQAMLGMKKLNIAELEQAANQSPVPEEEEA